MVGSYRFSPRQLSPRLGMVLVFFLLRGSSLGAEAIQLLEARGDLAPGGEMVLEYETAQLPPMASGRRAKGISRLAIFPLDEEWREKNPRPLVYEFNDFRHQPPRGFLRVPIPANPALANHVVRVRCDIHFVSHFPATNEPEMVETAQFFFSVKLGLARRGGLEGNWLAYLVLAIVVALVLLQVQEVKNPREAN